MLSLEEIKELVRILETSSLNKMELAYEDGKVLLEKGGAPVAVAVPQPMMPAVQPAAAPAEAPQPGEHVVEITAPIVGTFYSCLLYTSIWSTTGATSYCTLWQSEPSGTI